MFKTGMTSQPAYNEFIFRRGRKKRIPVAQLILSNQTDRRTGWPAGRNMYRLRILLRKPGFSCWQLPQLLPYHNLTINEWMNEWINYSTLISKTLKHTSIKRRKQHIIPEQWQEQDSPVGRNQTRTLGGGHLLCRPICSESIIITASVRWEVPVTSSPVSAIIEAALFKK